MTTKLALFIDPFAENTKERARIGTIHYAPELLSEEELEGAIMVEGTPDPTPREGYVPYLYCNPETKELWHEYEMTEPSEDERLEALERAMLELALGGGE